MGRHKRLSDNWTKRAKEKGYAARSVFKLEELDGRFAILQKAQRVVDFGCAPGSWSRYVKKKKPKVTLVGIDIKPLPNYCGQFLHGSIADFPPQQIHEMLGGQADVVLSDMAPNTTGDRFGDHIRQLEIAQLAFERAIVLLKPNGSFIVKVFDGEDANQFVQTVRPYFTSTKRVKPKATRGRSVEFFLVCCGFKDTTDRST